jgi:hypothetical protein
MRVPAIDEADRRDTRDELRRRRRGLGVVARSARATGRSGAGAGAAHIRAVATGHRAAVVTTRRGRRCGRPAAGAAASVRRRGGRGGRIRARRRDDRGHSSDEEERGQRGGDDRAPEAGSRWTGRARCRRFRGRRGRHRRRWCEGCRHRRLDLLLHGSLLRSCSFGWCGSVAQPMGTSGPVGSGIVRSSTVGRATDLVSIVPAPTERGLRADRPLLRNFLGAGVAAGEAPVAGQVAGGRSRPRRRLRARG